MAGGLNGPPILSGSAYEYPTKTLATLRDELLCMLGFPDPLLLPDAQTKTLVQLRDRVITMLGFIDPLLSPDVQTKTLLQLRDRMLTMLGFPDPLTSPDAQTKTLAQLREILLRRTGNRFAAGANPPGIDAVIDNFINEAQQTIFRTVELDKAGVAYPALMTADANPTEIDYVPVEAMALGLLKAHYGEDDAKAYFEQVAKYLQDRAARNPPNITDQLNAWINEAQQTVFRLAELDKGGVAFPALMTTDANPTEIDYVPVLNFALGLAKSHYKHDDAKVYFDQVTKYIQDRILRRPPNIGDQVDAWINEAQQTIFRLVELDKGGVAFPTPMVSDSDPVGIDYVPVLSHAVGLGKSHYQQKDAKIYFDQVAKYISDRAVRRPPKVVAMATQWLKLAQNQLYHKYKMLRTELWWPITLEAGERIYDVPYDASSALDFRTVKEVWIQEDTAWSQLTGGINPAQFSTTSQIRPTHFEFREYFEVFPEPDKAYTAWIKGHRGLLAFISDSDTTTIDPEVILLQALVWGKSHFRHADALLYRDDLRNWIGSMNAGRFAGLRFVPRETGTESFALPYPQVTFPRV